MINRQPTNTKLKHSNIPLRAFRSCCKIQIYDSVKYPCSFTRSLLFALIKYKIEPYSVIMLELRTVMASIFNSFTN